MFIFILKSNIFIHYTHRNIFIFIIHPLSKKKYEQFVGICIKYENLNLYLFINYITCYIKINLLEINVYILL